MDFIVNTKQPEVITVRKLIEVLLDSNMGDIIIVKDKEGIELHNVFLCTRKEDILSCLFG